MADNDSGAAPVQGLNPRQIQEALAPHLGGLLSLLTRATGSRDLAADVLQDAIVTALEKIQANELSDFDRIAGFVYRVALNHWRNLRRKNLRAEHSGNALAASHDATTEATPDRTLQERQWASAVRQALVELPLRRDREVIVRFFLYEQDKAEICQALGLSAADFTRVSHRARERLRELLMRNGLNERDLFMVGLILCCLAAAHFWGLP